MAHSDERCAYHMIFHELQYTAPSAVIAILNILSAILILHISDCLEHSRLSPVWCLFHSISPLSQEVVRDLAPLCPRTTLNIQGCHDLVNLWPQVSKILKPCYHGDILGSPKDVPELQWYNLIGQVSEYMLLSIDI